MSRKPVLILILVLAVYALLDVFHPGGLMAYALPSVCWGLLALATLAICGFERIQSWFNKRVSGMAALAAVFQIFILMDAGLLTRFGKSPYSFTPTYLMINSVYVSSALLGMELSRAYLMKNLGKKKPFLTLGLVTLLYTFINISLIGFLSLLTSNETLKLADFLGTKLLPTLTENLLASYLALLGGPIASIAYRAPIQAFTYFSPILPDLPWAYQALIGVMAPTIGFIAIDYATTPTQTIRRKAKSKKPHLSWTLIATVLVLTVWLSSGLLGPRLTIVLSGSMTPTMNIGDIALATNVDINTIQPNDIVQYWTLDRTMTIHRVVDIQQTEGTKLLITKGDANNAPDPDPVRPEQIRGKVIYIIPKLGWITIHTRTIISTLWSFFSANTTPAYAALATITLTSSIYAIHKHKSRPAKRWKNLHRKEGWPRK